MKKLILILSFLAVTACGGEENLADDFSNELSWGGDYISADGVVMELYASGGDNYTASVDGLTFVINDGLATTTSVAVRYFDHDCYSPMYIGRVSYPIQQVGDLVVGYNDIHKKAVKVADYSIHQGANAYMTLNGECVYDQYYFTFMFAELTELPEGIIPSDSDIAFDSVVVIRN